MKSNFANDLPLKTAALIAGLCLLFMPAPIAEFMVMQKLIVAGDVAQTIQNIRADETRFILGIFGFLTTFILDVIVAWALYLFLRPVHRSLALLAAWFRVIYSIIAVVALLNLVTVSHVLDSPALLAAGAETALQTQVDIAIHAYWNGISIGFIIFSVQLALLGTLVIKSEYVPSILGIFLIIAGAGYLVSNLKPFFFPDVPLPYIMITYFGELFFVLWLVFKGSRLKDSYVEAATM